MWENIVEELISKDFTIKHRPYFKNYEELGEIISRKATDLEDIQLETFEA